VISFATIGLYPQYMNINAIDVLKKKHAFVKYVHSKLEFEASLSAPVY
jgi:hypothetical protein